MFKAEKVGNIVYWNESAAYFLSQLTFFSRVLTVKTSYRVQEKYSNHFEIIERRFFCLDYKAIVQCNVLHWVSSVLSLDRGVQSGFNSLSFTPISGNQLRKKLYRLMLDLGIGLNIESSTQRCINKPKKEKINTDSQQLAQQHSHPCIIKASLNLCPFIYMAVSIWLAVFLLIWHTFSNRRSFGSAGSEHW